MERLRHLVRTMPVLRYSNWIIAAPVNAGRNQRLAALAVDRLKFYLLGTHMTYGILVEKVPGSELPTGFYYAHIPALGLTTHGKGIEGARTAAEDLIKLWLAEKKTAGEAVDVPSEFFFSTVDISESALQSA